MNSMECPMIMTFHGGHCERILWSGWVASTVAEFVLSAIAIFIAGFLYEALKFSRELYLRRTVKLRRSRPPTRLQINTNDPTTPLANNHQQSKIQQIFSWPHIIQSLMNFVQILLSYLLMMVFMTFNYWLCLAVVLGLSFGYFCFGWIKNVANGTECCE